MKFLYKSLIALLLSSFISTGGEYNEVNIPKDNCCDCCCEWIEQRDGIKYPFKSKEFLNHYRYFGGRKHICIDTNRQFLTVKDEKGGVVEFHYHFKDESVIHICTGVWCPRDCCIDVEEFFGGRYEEEQKLHWTDPHPQYPVIPTPPPVSRQN